MYFIFILLSHLLLLTRNYLSTDRNIQNMHTRKQDKHLHCRNGLFNSLCCVLFDWTTVKLVQKIIKVKFIFWHIFCQWDCSAHTGIRVDPGKVTKFLINQTNNQTTPQSIAPSITDPKSKCFMRSLQMVIFFLSLMTKCLLQNHS